MSVARAFNRPSMMVLSVACPAISSRTRISNDLRVTGPTFRPKPRRMPRMLSSMSISLPSRVLRAVMMARTSCEGRVLQWTGRYHPMRKSCAMPRVAAVCFDGHGRQRRLHMPGLEQDDRVAGLRQGGVEPLRQGPGLEPDAHDLDLEGREVAHQSLRL